MKRQGRLSTTASVNRQLSPQHRSWRENSVPYEPDGRPLPLFGRLRILSWRWRRGFAQWEHRATPPSLSFRHHRPMRRSPDGSRWLSRAPFRRLDAGEWAAALQAASLRRLRHDVNLGARAHDRLALGTPDFAVKPARHCFTLPSAPPSSQGFGTVGKLRRSSCGRCTGSGLSALAWWRGSRCAPSPVYARYHVAPCTFLPYVLRGRSLCLNPDSSHIAIPRRLRAPPR
jgi:hypothetical protein